MCFSLDHLHHELYGSNTHAMSVLIMYNVILPGNSALLSTCIQLLDNATECKLHIMSILGSGQIKCHLPPVPVARLHNIITVQCVTSIISKLAACKHNGAICAISHKNHI